MRPGPKAKDLKIRFYEKINKDKTNECWIWKSTMSNIGRGVMRIRGKTEIAQRVAWFLFNGDIPEKKSILNSCKNDLCVNPEHLYLDDFKNRRWRKNIQSLEHRFWKNVQMESKNECWKWLGKKDSHGYGEIRIFEEGKRERKLEKAHRISWRLMFHKSIPKGVFICHHCDNPGCVNPYHLFLGTHLDNMLDKKHKGRCNSPKGESHSFHKLTEQQVKEIKSIKIKYGDLTRLAKKYGVTKQAIKLIVNGKNWAHLNFS